MPRLAAPKSWPIERKISRWILRPVCGPHAIKNCLPIGVILKEILKHSKTTKEVNFILNQGFVLVNNIVRKDKKFPIGLMDVFEIKPLNESYRMVFSKKGKLSLLKIKDKGIRICKIIGKTTVKAKKTQLNLNDGRNILISKGDYHVGDSVVLDLAKQSIKDSLKLEKGAAVYLIGGKHIGYIGKVKDIIAANGLQKSKIVLDIAGKEFETLKEYAFVVGKEKPVIELGEN